MEGEKSNCSVEIEITGLPELNSSKKTLSKNSEGGKLRLIIVWVQNSLFIISLLAWK